jgi:murein DD-endopeptidase MepM/ murein hydrolase activator NlpD
MKALAISIALPLLGVTLLPVLLTNGDPPPPVICSQASGPESVILATIRTLESGGNYEAQSRGASASGAYQMVDGTWNGYGGYTHAKDAPPAMQDAKATELLRATLADHDNNVTAVPVVWYIGHLPAASSSEWDTVPRPDAGNRLTPRQYQARWMAEYHRQLAHTDEAAMSTPSSPTPGGCIGGEVVPLDGEWSLPGPRGLLDANPAALNSPHHDYPAWDWLIPVNTPVYAVRGGTVITVHQWPFNWWTMGCGQQGGGDCESCGVGLTIVDEAGTRWSYCHGTQATVQLGQRVRAGQQILWSGNSGRSGAPHVHVEINAGNEQRCPQLLLQSLYTADVGLDPTTLPTDGCSF